MISNSYHSFTSTSNPTPAQIPRFKIGVTGFSEGNWDPSLSVGGFSSWYRTGALEYLMEPSYSWSGEYDDLDPVLATNWTLFNWPEEMNYHPTDPFINEGGLMAIELTLREGITFHDGSAWNATVAKWNLDRTSVISGNITGSLTALDVEVSQMRYRYWLDAADWASYETDSWNVSQYIGQPATYGEYGTSGEAAMYGKYSRIKNVTIIDNLASGGKIKINFNDWGGANTQLQYIYNMPMISMDAYKDYFDLPIYGLGGSPGFPQPDISGGYPSTGFPGHLIGTGPYIFIEHDDLILQEGSMKINPNWWNSTAMQADGWHQVPEISVIIFSHDTGGLAVRNLAMVTGSIDLAYDNIEQGNLIYDDMIADPDINYFEMGTEPIRTSITLNGINETYWKTWADMGSTAFNASDPAGPIGDMSWMADIDADGTIHTDGINRALRKAISYAYDYDTFINVAQEGRAVRSGGFLVIGNEFYNGSIPIPYQNLTIARQALIDDPVWSAWLASKNLDINNATADWNWVANNDPIFEFKLMWDQANIDAANVFSTSIKDIGMTLGGTNGAPDPALEVTPDLYAGMFFQPQNFPWFTYHGVPTNWFDVNFDNLPSLEYFYKSPGLPFVNGSGNHFPNKAYLNMGFHYNSTIDDWFTRAWFANRTTLQEIMNNMTKHFQTYQYSDIFISHSKWGIATNKDWDYSNYWAGFAFEMVKHIEPPGGFTLSSNAGNPDTDGAFNLDWTVSTGADNYSIYSYSKFITQINGSITETAYQNATSPFTISGLSNGDYYFVIVAYNASGTTLSNNLLVEVRIPPGLFYLSSDAETPDTDGAFNLDWTVSTGADNYSIYSYSKFITQINGSLTEIAYQNATSPFAILGLSNGDYYFAIIAYNESGTTVSNNLLVEVRIPPGLFYLSSDADIPDTDGTFNLTWTTSARADNYSVYTYDKIITQINASLIILETQANITSLEISGLPSGFYYYIVVAYNKSGYTFSNCIEINVQYYDDLSGYWIINPLIIDDSGNGNYTWSQVATLPWCSGSGTFNDPYIIRNLKINGQDSGSCIIIKNSNEFFRIENCTLYDSGINQHDAGIKLIGVSNGELNTVNCSFNGGNGIVFELCQYIEITGSSVNNNDLDGILLIDCNYITIINNKKTINRNDFYGVHLVNSHNNEITDNTINLNQIGIYLEGSNNNTITYNDLLNNGKSHELEDSYDNILIGNNIGQNGFQIPFEMILLIIILSVVIIGSLSILIIVKKGRSIFSTKEKVMKKPGDSVLTVEKEEEHKHTVFISYSTLDSEYYQIEKIVRHLNKYPEIDKVLYWEKDSKGNIVEFMDRTLEESDVFILFCSESSKKSTAVRDEWQAAFQRRKKNLIKIIPVYEDEDHIPPLLGHFLNVKYAKDNFDTFIANLYREILR